jgi:RimJ/RimL family protein N-acetyltransferase
MPTVRLRSWRAQDAREIASSLLTVPGRVELLAAPAARGRGLARAAVESIVEWAAAATELRSVVFDIEVTNAPSVGRALRLGAQRREPDRIEHDRSGHPRRMVVLVLAIER